MLSSSRFVVAVHALSILARSPDRQPVCSALIAQSVHTNPVVIRRLMSALEKSKLVQSVAGRAGGFVLSRAADAISLAEIYDAVEDKSVFRMHKTDPDAQCPVALQMSNALSPFLRTAEVAMAEALGKTSLRQVVASIH